MNLLPLSLESLLPLCRARLMIKIAIVVACGGLCSSVPAVTPAPTPAGGYPNGNPPQGENSLFSLGNSLSYPDSAQYPAGTPTQSTVSNGPLSRTVETEKLNVQVVYGATHSVITDADLSGGAGTQLTATGKGQFRVALI